MKRQSRRVLKRRCDQVTGHLERVVHYLDKLLEVYTGAGRDAVVTPILHTMMLDISYLLTDISRVRNRIRSETKEGE